MARAVCNGVVVADSDDVIRLETNAYFPPTGVYWEHLLESPTRTLCFWKGMASYYIVTAGEGTLPDAAWSYQHPSPLARGIRGHVAFGSGVRIEYSGNETRGVFRWLTPARSPQPPSGRAHPTDAGMRNSSPSGRHPQLRRARATPSTPARRSP